MLTLMRPDTAGVHRRARVMVIVELSPTAGVTVTERRWGAQRRDGGDGRHERRARRVNDGDRTERSERRRDQMRIRGGGPRGRQESDERGGDGKEGGKWGEGGRAPALTPAAAATDGDGRRARRGDARQAAGAGKHARHGRRRVVSGGKGPHHRGGGERSGAGARRGAARRHRGHGGRRRRTADHVQPGPPSAVGGEWRVDGGFGGFTATGGDAAGRPPPLPAQRAPAATAATAAAGATPRRRRVAAGAERRARG